MRVVLDTNCLLQILGAQSQYNFLLDKFLDGQYILCVSTDILLEYEEILNEKASAIAADMFLKVISRSRNVIRKDPFYRLGLIQQDADDNKFTDCAFASQADIIVSNDSHFRELEKMDFPLLRVITLAESADMMK